MIPNKCKYEELDVGLSKELNGKKVYRETTPHLAFNFESVVMEYTEEEKANIKKVLNTLTDILSNLVVGKEIGLDMPSDMALDISFIYSRILQIISLSKRWNYGKADEVEEDEINL